MMMHFPLINLTIPETSETNEKQPIQSFESAVGFL